VTSWRGAAAWALLFAVLVFAGTQLIDGGSGGSGSGSSKPATPRGERTAKVLRVVDGDTIIVRVLGGRVERVRYIGVDTPESVKPDAPVECFGPEAKSFNRKLVDGEKVRLVPDREAEDRFGRTLAFVYVGGLLVNAELLREGYARTIEIPPNTSRAAEFDRLQSVAMRTSKGLWKACRR
jgi:micrococcal nuclease